MTPFDSSVKIKTGKRPHGMLPADPSVAADMPDLTGTAIVHNQRYDESVTARPAGELHHPRKVHPRLLHEVDRCTAEAGCHYGYIAFGREHDGAFGIGKKFAAKQEDGTYVLAIRPNYRGGSVAQILCFEPNQASRACCTP